MTEPTPPGPAAGATGSPFPGARASTPGKRGSTKAGERFERESAARRALFVASVAGVVGAFGLIAATEQPEAPANPAPAGATGLAEPGNRVLAEFPIESLPGASDGRTVVRIVAADPRTTSPSAARVRTRASS